RKDLLIGQADGTIKIFLNIGADSNPVFDAGQLVMVSSPGVPLDAGARATPAFLDWDNDFKTDLVIGGYDGKIRLYLNCGCGGAIPPHFYTSSPSGIPVQADGSDLVVPSVRSSPVIMDLDGDGRKDILTGNTNGQLLFYSNVGTDAAPAFSGYSLVESDGVPIDLPDSPRSRPDVCYWTGDGHFGPIDGYPDVLIGAGDGKVRLYQGKPHPGDIDGDGDVDFTDFASFAVRWRQSACGQCGAADLTADGNVNTDDLREFAANWLLGLD
ncbi:MAG: hypothetical protein JSW27_05655, partial [Phycisphaerales bacterium]